MAREKIISPSFGVVEADFAAFDVARTAEHIVVATSIRPRSQVEVEHRKSYFESLWSWASNGYLGVGLQRPTVEGIAQASADSDKKEILLDKIAESIMLASQDKRAGNTLAGLSQAENLSDIAGVLRSVRGGLEGMEGRVLMKMVEPIVGEELNIFVDNLNSGNTRGDSLLGLYDNLGVVLRDDGLTEIQFERISSFRIMVQGEIVDEFGPEVILAPRFFKEMIVSSGIKDSYLIGKMNGVTTMLENSDLGQPMDREALKVGLHKLADSLLKSKKPPVEEVKVARRVLGQMIKVLEGDGEKDKLEAHMLSGMGDFYQAMLIHEAQQNVDPFSEMAPVWMRNHPDKAILQKIISLHNSAFMKLKFGNQFLDELVDPKGQGVYSASNEAMRKLYEQVPGVKESLGYFTRYFFEPSRENGVFVLRLKGWTAVQEVKQRDPENYKKSPEYKRYKDFIEKTYGNLRAVQMQQVNNLLGSRGIVSNRAEALQATAISWAILFVGNTFESADVDKDIPPCEAVTAQAWNFCHPENKARNKVLNKEKDVGGKTLGTEEGWGGQKGQWLARRFEKARSGSKEDVDFVEKFKRGEITPFPKRLFCSFVEDYEVETSRGSMTAAEALYYDIDIDFSKMSLSSDPWGSYYDMADSANKLYQATTGKVSLPLEARGWDDTLKWAGMVADARNKLRLNRLLRPYIDNPEFVLWAIVASVKGGIFMESPELVLLTPDVRLGSQQRNLDLFLKTRDLVDSAGAKYIKEKLHCDGYASEYTRSKIMNPVARNLEGKR